MIAEDRFKVAMLKARCALPRTIAFQLACIKAASNTTKAMEIGIKDEPSPAKLTENTPERSNFLQ